MRSRVGTITCRVSPPLSAYCTSPLDTWVAPSMSYQSCASGLELGTVTFDCGTLIHLQGFTLVQLKPNSLPSAAGLSYFCHHSFCYHSWLLFHCLHPICGQSLMFFQLFCFHNCLGMIVTVYTTQNNNILMRSGPVAQINLRGKTFALAQDKVKNITTNCVNQLLVWQQECFLQFLQYSVAFVQCLAITYY